MTFGHIKPHDDLSANGLSDLFNLVCEMILSELLEILFENSIL